MLAPAVASLVLIPLARKGPHRWRLAANYVAPIGLAAITQGWTQRYLYGGWFASGYGQIGGLFSWDTLAINAWIYTHWSWAAFGPVWLAAVAIGLAARREPRRDWSSR